MQSCKLPQTSRQDLNWETRWRLGSLRAGMEPLTCLTPHATVNLTGSTGFARLRGVQLPRAVLLGILLLPPSRPALVLLPSLFLHLFPFTTVLLVFTYSSSEPASHSFGFGAAAFTFLMCVFACNVVFFTALPQKIIRLARWVNYHKGIGDQRTD